MSLIANNYNIVPHPDNKMQRPEKSTLFPDIVMSYLIIIMPYPDIVITHFGIKCIMPTAYCHIPGIIMQYTDTTLSHPSTMAI